MCSRILRKCIGRITESLLGLVALWVILLPERSNPIGDSYAVAVGDIGVRGFLSQVE